MRQTRAGATAWLAGTAVLLLAAPAAGFYPAAGLAGEGVCTADPGAPEYYSIPLSPTKRVPGTAAAAGAADVLFGSTPFGVSVAADGSYLYDLRIRVRNLPEPRRGAWVAWVTTPGLDRIERLGALSSDGALRGPVRWNKFLVVVTLEPETSPAAEDDGDDGAASPAWRGPIVLRGMSRSGMMHTMAGHGPFQQENCAAYGF